MNEKGLLVKPSFYNPEYYLLGGKYTSYDPLIDFIAKNKIQGNMDGEKVRNIISFMNKNISEDRVLNREKKFKRAAGEILADKQRLGCTDSSILFCSIARGMGIPSMSIVCFDKDWAEKEFEGKARGVKGHVYSGVYLKDIDGKQDWYLVDSDAPTITKAFLKIKKLDLENRNVDRNRYAFAYVRDIDEIELDGMKIDSEENMCEIQRRVLRLCDKKDFLERERE